MLEKEDLQAIQGMLENQKTGIMQDVSGMFAQQKTDIMQDVSGIMDTKLAQQKTEIMQDVSGIMDTKLAQQKTEIMQEVSVLMDSKFDPKFKLLAEGQQAILDKLIPVSRVEELEEKVRFLEVMMRQLSEDMLLLKKA